MVKYIGPRLKIIRRIGALPGFKFRTVTSRKKSPGEHGTKCYLRRFKYKPLAFYQSENSRFLKDRQRIRFNYSLTFQKYKKYSDLQKKLNKDILILLEERFDVVTFKLGFSFSIQQARQFILHGQLLLNNKVIKNPGYVCKAGDVISVNKKLTIFKYIKRIIKFRIKIGLFIRKVAFKLQKRKYSTAGYNWFVTSQYMLDVINLKGTLKKSFNHLNTLVQHRHIIEKVNS